MNDKPLSQIDFKLNQTLVFNYLSRCSRRGNLKVAAKERKTEKKKERGGVWEWGAAECEEREGEGGRSERNANDSVPAWCQNRWPSGGAGA